MIAGIETLIPVIDISHHQGDVDFAVMRRNMVAGIIMRCSIGSKRDSRVVGYVRGARAAGYHSRDIGFYTFIVPTDGTPEASARVAIAAILTAYGSTDTFLMLDVESYEEEIGGDEQPIRGAAFQMYLQLFIAECARRAPTLRIIFYTGAPYWNGYVANDPAQGAFINYDCILARYPFYYEGAHIDHPVPPRADKWAEWILNETPKRPALPWGFRDYDGWQFSAGFNKMGRTYGAKSTDIDLNIVDGQAWARWTQPTSLPTPGKGIKRMFFVKNSDTPTDDPVRYVCDGIRIRRPRDQEEADTLALHGLMTNTLTTPVLMSGNEIADYAGANTAQMLAWDGNQRYINPPSP